MFNVVFVATYIDCYLMNEPLLMKVVCLF